MTVGTVGTLGHPVPVRGDHVPDDDDDDQYDGDGGDHVPDDHVMMISTMMVMVATCLGNESLPQMGKRLRSRREVATSKVEMVEEEMEVDIWRGGEGGRRWQGGDIFPLIFGYSHIIGSLQRDQTNVMSCWQMINRGCRKIKKSIEKYLTVEVKGSFEFYLEDAS